jgi:hypothetical protein
MTIKDDLHQLVDQLDEDTAREALALLQDLRLPRFLREAPIDNAPETDKERAAIAEAEAAIAAGDGVRTRTSRSADGHPTTDRGHRTRGRRVCRALP